MNNDEIILLVQKCIVNSESKLDSAQILAENRKFEDAIVWTIIAYEEAGKADFFITKIIDKETVSDIEWRDLTKGGSHETKLIMYYENKKKTFEEMSDSNFTTVQTLLNKNSPVLSSTDQLLVNLEKKIKLFKKLNILKKNITYVDNQSKNKKLTENELDAIFSYLDFETRMSISSTKTSLDSYFMGSTGNGLEDLKKLKKLDSFKHMAILREEPIISNNVQKFTLAESLLEKM